MVDDPPGRTVFFFDADGYQTAIVDKNGNTLSFTYEQRKSNNKPIKFLEYVTDAAGRRTLTVDYYDKGQTYDYVDSGTGAKVTGATNLTNPKIIDQVESITDVSGRTLKLVYADKGLLSELTDGAGDAKAKVFRFGYDATQGNKNVKLVAVTDPRGHASTLSYYDAPTDPKFKWSLQTLTDRLKHATGFAYTDPDGATGDNIQTTVTDAENHATTTRMDGFRRPVTTTDAKAKTSTLSWDTDHNVTSLQAPDTSVTKWTYDPKTGNPLTLTDAQAVADATPATVLTYATSPDGFVADLATKTSPEGRKWTFAYDNVGNLTGVTDPKGTATATAGDYTTTYAYDALGQLTTATDANGRSTGYSGYDAVGYPKTITDPLTKATTFAYDVRGNVISVTDANSKASTYGPYDVFGRPGQAKEPKDQAGNVYITTPAPVFDGNDQIASVTDPKNAGTDPDRVTGYTYDRVGNLTFVTAPKGTLTTADPNDFVTRYGYDELNQLTAVTDAAGKLAT